MAIKRARKANPNFNMSSMTDIVFLLLIFYPYQPECSEASVA